MPQLVSVTHEEFSNFMSRISQKQWVGYRLTDFINGDHGVQFPLADGVVVGEIIYSRLYKTVWKILPDKVQNNE